MIHSTSLEATRIVVELGWHATLTVIIVALFVLIAVAGVTVYRQDND